MGKTSRLTTELFIERSRLVFGDLYDYSKSMYTNNRNKICVICKKHGEFFQIPRDHMRGIGCKKCGNDVRNSKNSYTHDEFISLCENKHGVLYDYSESKYLGSFVPIEIKCKKHGIFTQKPVEHIRGGGGCPKCRYVSVSEKTRSTTNEFISKAEKIHNYIYDYSKVEYKTAGDVVTILCKKHGDFIQNASSHLNGRGCPKCCIDKRRTIKHDTCWFVEKSKAVHGDVYDYSMVVYSGIWKYVDIICKEHGVFKQAANHHIYHRSGCPICKIK